jgi:hypothetical protein
MENKEELIKFDGIIKFKIVEEPSTTMIIAGNKQWKLIKQMLNVYILMGDGKVGEFEGDYNNAYKKSLKIIYDIIIKDINENFNILINMEGRE